VDILDRARAVLATQRAQHSIWFPTDLIRDMAAEIARLRAVAPRVPDYSKVAGQPTGSFAPGLLDDSVV
jgi:hypothetical protein